MTSGQITHLINYMKLLPYNEWLPFSKFGKEEKKYMLDNLLPYQTGKNGYVFETNGISTDYETITKIRKLCMCNSGKCNRCGAKWIK